jgi:hypothetical protein
MSLGPSTDHSHSVSGLAPKKTYDVRFLVSVVIVAVGVVVAVCAVAAHRGPNEVALIMAVPP